MPATVIRFCPIHHWQHLDDKGRCAWCERKRILDEEAKR